MVTRKPKWTRHIYSMGAVDSMTRKELSSVVSELSSVANKRLKYLESKGIQYYADSDRAGVNHAHIVRYMYARGMSPGSPLKRI